MIPNQGLKYYISCDECGDNGLDFSKSLSHFILTGIVIENNKLAEVEQKFQYVSDKYFHHQPIKSSDITDDQKRINILIDLCKADFRIFGLIVNKELLLSKGYEFKPSFYKNIFKQLFKKFRTDFPNAEIYYANIGDEAFMNSFREYVYKNDIPDLFNQYSFDFVQSKSNLVAQVSDFVSGKLMKCYEKKKLSENRKTFLAILEKNIHEIIDFPLEYANLTYRHNIQDDNFNRKITEFCVGKVQDYIEKNEDSEKPYEQEKVNCLKYLLFHFLNISTTDYIRATPIIKYISQKCQSKISDDLIKRKVIANLRDNDVIIATTLRGYKIPSSLQDIYNFVNMGNSQIIPMLDRISTCRNVVKKIKKNIDILEPEEYRIIRVAIENLSKITKELETH